MIFEFGAKQCCSRNSATSSRTKDELFGLTAQIRRAGASIPANIAEGYGRENPGSYVQFLRIAQGSCKEVETHVLLAGRVIERIGEPTELLGQCEIVGKMLRGLIRSIKETQA
ncbi:MAG TPA: four helix bundle protein [Vitreimonas sp.]|nr:four helix bundle protein [Vitreimonas sp.]